MSSHANHADALRAFLIADGDPGPRFESSELATCAECARVVTEHSRLLDELERLGDDERASIAAAGMIATTPGRAEAALRERVLDDVAQMHVPQRRRSRWITAAIAAALVAFAFVMLRSRDEHPTDDDRVLGPAAGLLHPRGHVESFSPFHWDVELPAGGHFVVHVDGEGVDVDSPWLTAQEWTPADTSQWPAKIRWRLEVYRASGPGDLVASYIEWAER